MIESLRHLPAHALVVHAPIVLVPLCFVFTFLMVAVPTARQRFAGLTVLLAVASLAGAYFSTRSGTSLEQHNAELGRDITVATRNHADTSHRVPLIVGLYLVVLIVWLVRSRRTLRIENSDEFASRRPQVVAAILLTLLLGSSLAAVVTTWNATVTGARSVWLHDEPN